MGVRQPFTLTVVSVHHGEFIELLKFYNVEISMDGIGSCKDTSL